MNALEIAEWGNLYEKLEQSYETFAGKVMVDSVFPQGRYPFIIKSAQDECDAESASEIVEMRQATSFRQASE